MTQLEYWRVLAIKVAAAGPYQLVDRCHYCQAEEALASFQPSAFAARIACCRRCREARTGVPDTRGLILGTAAVSRPSELPTPVRIAGLIPATCPEPRPDDDGSWAKRPEYSMLDVDAIFAPWGSSAGEIPEIPGDRSGIDAELLALTDLDAQLDAMIAALDRQNDEGLKIPNPSTHADVPALTLDAMADLRAKYGRGSLRIVAGCPACPTDAALELEARAVLFIGSGMLEELERLAKLAGNYREVGIDAIAGVKIEPWGSKDDHAALGLDLVRALASP